MTAPDAVEALVKAAFYCILPPGHDGLHQGWEDGEWSAQEHPNGLLHDRRAAGYRIVREEEGLANVEAWSQRWHDFVIAVEDTGLDEATRIALIDAASAAAGAATRLPAPPPALDVERLARALHACADVWDEAEWDLPGEPEKFANAIVAAYEREGQG